MVAFTPPELTARQTPTSPSSALPTKESSLSEVSAPQSSRPREEIWSAIQNTAQPPQGNSSTISDGSIAASLRALAQQQERFTQKVLTPAQSLKTGAEQRLASSEKQLSECGVAAWVAGFSATCSDDIAVSQKDLANKTAHVENLNKVYESSLETKRAAEEMLLTATRAEAQGFTNEAAAMRKGATDLLRQASDALKGQKPHDVKQAAETIAGLQKLNQKLETAVNRAELGETIAGGVKETAHTVGVGVGFALGGPLGGAAVNQGLRMVEGAAEESMRVASGEKSWKDAGASFLERSQDALVESSITGAAGAVGQKIGAVVQQFRGPTLTKVVDIVSSGTVQSAGTGVQIGYEYAKAHNEFQKEHGKLTGPERDGAYAKFMTERGFSLEEVSKKLGITFVAGASAKGAFHGVEKMVSTGALQRTKGVVADRVEDLTNNVVEIAGSGQPITAQTILPALLGGQVTHSAVAHAVPHGGKSLDNTAPRDPSAGIAPTGGLPAKLGVDRAKLGTVISFKHEFITQLTPKGVEKIETILKSDERLDGKGVASPEGQLDKTKLAAELAKHATRAELSPQEQKVLSAFAAYYHAYVAPFPDKSETEPATSIFSYLTDRSKKWDVLVRTDTEGNAIAAASGQLIGLPSGAKGMWLEHVWTAQDKRGEGLGKEIYKAANESAKQRGAHFVAIEIDNPYMLSDNPTAFLGADPIEYRQRIDRGTVQPFEVTVEGGSVTLGWDPATHTFCTTNKELLGDSSSLSQYWKGGAKDVRANFWTEELGMSMDPFGRFDYWTKNGFQLSTGKQGNTELPTPYTQIGMDPKDPEPCETICKAFKILSDTSPVFTKALTTEWYHATQGTIDERYSERLSFLRTQEHLKLIGEEVTLYPVNSEKAKQALRDNVHAKKPFMLGDDELDTDSVQTALRQRNSSINVSHPLAPEREIIVESLRAVAALTREISLPRNERREMFVELASSVAKGEPDAWELKAFTDKVLSQEGLSNIGALCEQGFMKPITAARLLTDRDLTPTITTQGDDLLISFGSHYDVRVASSSQEDLEEIRKSLHSTLNDFGKKEPKDRASVLTSLFGGAELS